MTSLTELKNETKQETCTKYYNNDLTNE